MNGPFSRIITNNTLLTLPPRRTTQNSQRLRRTRTIITIIQFVPIVILRKTSLFGIFT